MLPPMGKSDLSGTCPKLGLIIVGIALVLVGCAGQRVMMPTPNVHLEPDYDVFGTLDPGLKTTDLQMFFLTDRAPEQDDEGNLRYGYRRSGSMAFGRVVVEMGQDITWEELVEASRKQRRLKPVALEIIKVEEFIRSAKTPIPFTEVDGKIVIEPEAEAEWQSATDAFRSLLVQQLELTPRKEVFIFVHGFHNTFDDATFAMAELWHFLGRIGIPIVYTWPAGYPGLFGYTYDRESSEFTVYHMRKVIELISSFPEVDKIHLIAHSRGTDVALSALRELTIGARAAGIDPRERFKVHNLILAAPDLDLEVTNQRMIGDQLSLSVNRFTIYSSPRDRALGSSNLLFRSPEGRVGTLGIDELPEEVADQMDYSNSNFAIVNFEGASDATPSGGDRWGHSYFRDAPTVSSDLVLMLRDDLDPGPPGRPLERIGRKFWRVPSGYPAFSN